MRNWLQTNGSKKAGWAAGALMLTTADGCLDFYESTMGLALIIMSNIVAVSSILLYRHTHLY